MLGRLEQLPIERRRATAVRSARLTGTAYGAGVVLGRAGIVPTTTAVADALRAAATDADGRTNVLRSATELDRVLARLRDDLGRALKKLADCDDDQIGGVLDRFTLALCDQRLRERLLAAAGEPSGLRAVANRE